jgi:hypothetical protein
VAAVASFGKWRKYILIVERLVVGKESDWMGHKESSSAFAY